MLSAPPEMPTPSCPASARSVPMSGSLRRQTIAPRRSHASAMAMGPGWDCACRCTAFEVFATCTYRGYDTVQLRLPVLRNTNLDESKLRSGGHSSSGPATNMDHRQPLTSEGTENDVSRYVPGKGCLPGIQGRCPVTCPEAPTWRLAFVL